jgi:hypothetical protein
LTAAEGEFKEAARRRAFLHHRKDRQEVLERHLRVAREERDVVAALPVHSATRLRVEGDLQGLEDLAGERTARAARPAGTAPEVLERQARAKKRAYASIREEIAYLDELMGSAVDDEGDVVWEEEDDDDDVGPGQGPSGWGGPGGDGGAGGAGGVGIAV